MSEPKICPLGILHDSKNVMNCLKDGCMAWRRITYNADELGTSSVTNRRNVTDTYCIILRAIEKYSTGGDK